MQSPQPSHTPLQQSLLPKQHTPDSWHGSQMPAELQWPLQQSLL
jgi:hypothetical protein